MAENTAGAQPSPVPDRRRGRALRSGPLGDTSAFELTPIVSANGRENGLEPMFLVVRGVQRGRPIAVRDGQWTIGRGPVCDVSLQGRGISRTHLRVDSSAETGVIISDADSTNGVFVNGKPAREHALRDGDLVQIGPETVLSFVFASASEIALRVRQYEHAVVDDLTGVHNRRYLMSSLEHEMAFSLRRSEPLCLMLVDIDRFKRVNDLHGHQAGDAILKQIAERIADGLRTEDIFARLGGEEFAAVMRGVMADDAERLAERVRARVGEESFSWQGQTICCTVSVGCAMLAPDDDRDILSLLRRADENLYRAKNAGRNCAVVN